MPLYKIGRERNEVRIKTIILMIMSLTMAGCAVRNKEQVGQQNIENLLAAMTLEEKIGQMTQVDFSVIGAVVDPQGD